MNGILVAFPDIGETIEEYVQERSIGADAWRRTGVFTFDGNSTVKEKVTYSRIKITLSRSTIVNLGTVLLSNSVWHGIVGMLLLVAIKV